jgi:hypothetical protein
MLSKSETVQDYKDLIIEDKSNGNLYTGDNARSLLRLPAGGTIQLSPTMSNDYNVYVRSTSWNRKARKNGAILVRNAERRNPARRNPARRRVKGAVPGRNVRTGATTRQANGGRRAQKRDSRGRFQSGYN